MNLAFAHALAWALVENSTPTFSALNKAISSDTYLNDYVL